MNTDETQIKRGHVFFLICVSSAFHLWLKLAFMCAVAMHAQLGKPLDDFVFRKPDDSEVRLSDFSNRPLVLIFLRHLA